MLDAGCSNSPGNSSKIIIIGISIAVFCVVLLIIAIAVRVWKKMKARHAGYDSGLLDEVPLDSDSDSPPRDQGPSTTLNNNWTPGIQQQFIPSPSPSWLGQPLATTPMVLMTQTGEPIVVQVAYM
jgi:hypothetical protein